MQSKEIEESSKAKKTEVKETKLDSLVSKLNYHVTDNQMSLEELNKIVQNEYELSRIPVYYFSASWCPPCREFKEALSNNSHGVYEELKDFTFIEISMEDSGRKDTSQLSTKLSYLHKIRSIPMFTKVDNKGNPTNKILSTDWLTKEPNRIDEFIERISIDGSRRNFKKY